MLREGHIFRDYSFFSKLRKHLYFVKLLSVFILFSTLIFIIQFCVEGFVGIDPYYHVKVSELMMQHGILKEFPWTQISIWKNQFSDKEFLFHVYLMPFIFILPSLMIAGKVAISVLGGTLFTLFYRFLNLFRIRHPFIWTLIGFGVNYTFLQRVCMIRPHVLSVVLILLFVEALWKRQGWNSYSFRRYIHLPIQQHIFRYSLQLSMERFYGYIRENLKLDHSYLRLLEQQLVCLFIPSFQII